MATIRLPRGTKAALDALATAGSLAEGQAYWLTDTDRIAVALTTSTYALFSRTDELDTAIAFVIDGVGATITIGVKGDLQIPFACTILGWSLFGDQSGSIVVDIWKDTPGNFPPTIADVITASAKPTITTATNASSSTLTGWTTAIAADDVLRFNVNSVTSLQRATLSLKVRRG